MSGVRRREFVSLFGGAAVVWPMASRAQQPAMPVIGCLYTASRDGSAVLVGAFRQGLKETGYVEGENVAMNIAGPTIKAIGCPRWRSNWFANESP